jgi:hypothetical protein
MSGLDVDSVQRIVDGFELLSAVRGSRREWPELTTGWVRIGVYLSQANLDEVTSGEIVNHKDDHLRFIVIAFYFDRVSCDRVYCDRAGSITCRPTWLRFF